MLYLVRHADALEAEHDELRPLSPRGGAQIAALAKFLARTGTFRPDELWHSPLVRARETAQLLRQHLALQAPLVLKPDLRPEDDPAATARRLHQLQHPIAIVGHEPHLSALASLLVRGAAEPPVFIMKKSAVLALEPAGSCWLVHWHVSPDVIG